MNDKELHKTDNSQESINSDWKFCPICGNPLPSIQNLKFCIVCGTNIIHIKEFKKFGPTYTSNPYKSPMKYSQNNIPSIPSIYYGRELIADEELIDYKKHKLWSTTTSIGLAFAAFLILNIVVGGFLSLIMLLSFDFDIIYNLLSNSYLTSLILLFELIFLILPILYVRKYLQNPTLKNSLILLGFTTRGYDNRRISKEILIGLSFAVIGVLVVFFVSFIIEITLELFFGITIIQDSTGLTGVLIPPDLASLIVFSTVIILVIGTSEEILFRGFMQKGLVRSLGDRWGLIVTALIFSLIHLLGVFPIALESPFLFIISFLLSFPPYFAISLILGWLYLWRNENLLAVMITHGVYDVLIILISYIIYGLL